MAQTKERRKHFKNIVVEVPIFFYENVEAEAKRRKQTKSDLVRAAINEYLNK